MSRWLSIFYNASTSVKEFITRIVERQSFSDLNERYKRLQTSLSSPIGTFLQEHEHTLLENLSKDIKSQRILHLSALHSAEVPQQSAFQRVTRVYPCYESVDGGRACLAGSSASILAAKPSALPFESNSFDLVVVQHVLEFSSHPQQVLKEAARVTENGGHLIILGFNPVSGHGLFSLLWGRLKPDSFWYRRALLAYRVRDWLSFVDFSNLATRHACHSLPLNYKSILNFTSPLSRLLTRFNVPFSSVYCLLSRKDELGFTQPKVDWKRVMLARALPVATPAPSAASHSNSRVNTGYNNPHTKH